MESCVRCLYTKDIVPDLVVDEEGMCNYCRMHDDLERQYPTNNTGKYLKELANTIAKSGRGNRYDCVVGFSGGCDSSYVLHLAVKDMGLRCLAVNFDNGWGTEIADNNIKNVASKLNVDLLKIGVDELEMNDIYRAFVRSGIPQIDAPADIALAAAQYMAASAFDVKYIIDGHSFRTEGIAPIGWIYFDGKFIYDVHRKLGEIPMRTYPNLWFWQWMKYIIVDRIKRVRPLYYVDYNSKEAVKKFLSDTYGWEWYGSSHDENRMTKFCGKYLMPKYNMDHRYTEYSGLIRSDYISREGAIREIEKPLPDCSDILEEIITRLKLNNTEIKNLTEQEQMSIPSFKNYASYKRRFELLRPFFWVLSKMDLVPKTFYMKYTRKNEWS